MKLCEELKQWKLHLPNQSYMLPTMPKRKSRHKVRRKRKPPDPPENVTITLNDTGSRTVVVKRAVPKREKQISRRLSVEEGGESGTGNGRSQNISTQTTLHDLEFLLTDPRIRETGPRGSSYPDEVTYTRQATAHRTYRTGVTTLKVEHRTTDNIVVQIDTPRGRPDNGLDNGQKGNKYRVRECRKEEEDEERTDKEETNRKCSNSAKRTTFADEVVNIKLEADKEKTDGTAKVRAPSKVAKACGHRLPMIRVGGGWMEVPDYLRFHVPMHVHAETTKDGQEGNLIIRSQRPRSQLFSKKGESPSWTATLSRGTKGSASTTMRQRLL
ncbi:uncharacterized protein LOC117326877 [Pecten maximus]|uniref:uncharacterized protein LOC117326877 n=1 Tax=Pecten maximus TaxID=6579 RepID=UPI0014587ACC|nr:uncharacterized protein LOC117326877 [Pecten maximus]